MKVTGISNLVIDPYDNGFGMNQESFPLHRACELGQVDAVQFLLNNEGIDVNETDNLGRTPLLVACEKGHQEIVNLLFGNNRINITADQLNTLLVRACRLGYAIGIVGQLIANGANVNTLPAVVEPSKQQDVRSRQRAQRGYPLSKHPVKRPPLYVACQNGHSEIVNLLLEKGAEKTNINGLLDIACQNNDTDTAKVLAEHGAKIEGKEGYWHLLAACEKGSIEIVKLLIKQGVQITRFAPPLKSPLEVACISGHIDIVELLINAMRSQNIPVDDLQELIKLARHYNHDVLKGVLESLLLSS